MNEQETCGNAVLDKFFDLYKKRFGTDECKFAELRSSLMGAWALLMVMQDEALKSDDCRNDFKANADMICDGIRMIEEAFADACKEAA